MSHVCLPFTPSSDKYLRSVDILQFAVRKKYVILNDFVCYLIGSPKKALNHTNYKYALVSLIYELRIEEKNYDSTIWAFIPHHSWQYNFAVVWMNILFKEKVLQKFEIATRVSFHLQPEVSPTA